MKVYVVIHQYERDGDAGYVSFVFATREAAEHNAEVQATEARRRGAMIYGDDEENDRWDEDFVVEEHELRGAP